MTAVLPGALPDGVLDTAHSLADAAGSIIREALSRGLAVETKPDGSPVTDADRAVEAALRDRLAQRYPGHGVLGEEFGADGLEREFVWVIDPIDGTRQFVAGLPNFATLIALCHRGRPLLGVIDQPLLGQRCVGIAGRDTRLNGQVVTSAPGPDLAGAILSSAGPPAFEGSSQGAFERLTGRAGSAVFDGGCLGYISLAKGAVHICLDGTNLEPFDICALVPVVEAAGGKISDLAGRALDIGSHGAILAACCARLHGEALAAACPP